MNEPPTPDPGLLPPRAMMRVGAPPFLTGKVIVVLFGTLMALAVGLLPFIGPSSLFIALLAFPLAFVVTAIPATFVIGSDGIAVAWLGRRMFLPYSALEREVRTEVGVTIYATGGRTLELRTRGAERLLGLVYGRKGAMHSVQSLYAEERLASDASSLAPHGTTEDWATRLRRIGQGDYRVASLPRERLLAVVATPSLAPELRVAAAVALGPPETDEEAHVLGRAVQSTASRTLERALWNASSDDLRRAKPGLGSVLAASRREADDTRREPT